jgi:hypothetical protein
MEHFVLPPSAKLLVQAQPQAPSASLILDHSKRRLLATERRQTPPQSQVHTSLLQGAWHMSRFDGESTLIATLHGGVKIDLNKKLKTSAVEFEGLIRGVKKLLGMGRTR